MVDAKDQNWETRPSFFICIGDSMDTWKHLVGDRSFISDLGKNQEADIAGTITVLGRYAVWVSVPGTDRHRIVEVGDDLSVLMEKYDVPSELVLKLGSFMP